MRSISGARNRTALALAGLAALAAAVLLAAVPLDLGAAWPQLVPALPEPGTELARFAQAHRTGLLPAAVALAALGVAAGIALLRSQIPARPDATRRRVLDEDGTLLASFRPQVLERALAEQVEAEPGVRSAVVRLGGPLSAPWIQASIGVAEDAEISAAIAGARALLAREVRTVLGADPDRVDVLVALRTAAARGRRPAHVEAARSAPSGPAPAADPEPDPDPAPAPAAGAGAA
ncbi:hypothetical protein [Brachybacterium phenoliresistens]|uniref:hypothetical protein n=1 Tax=Brachybacterium phenoliresistens TaxID=396014 RepID=UPI0031D6C9BB